MAKTRLLVTGGCGFVGSNFINRVHPQGDYHIVNIDAMHYAARSVHVDEAIRKSEDYTLVKGDIQNSALLEKTLAEHQITQIVHFAAQSHVQDSFYDSLRYSFDNIVGTHTLLEAVRKHGKISRFVHISTDEVYGESTMDGADAKKQEDASVLCPTNPYAATKAAAEMLVNSEFFSFRLPALILRANNIYGLNQHEEKLIPRFIGLLKAGKKVTVQGDGSAIRSFLHADDMADAALLVLRKGKIGETYNVAAPADNEYSVMEIARMLIEMVRGTDDHARWIEYIEDRPFNDCRYWINGDKIRALGWSPKIEFLPSLKALIEHY